MARRGKPDGAARIADRAVFKVTMPNINKKLAASIRRLVARAVRKEREMCVNKVAEMIEAERAFGGTAKTMNVLKRLEIWMATKGTP